MARSVTYKTSGVDIDKANQFLRSVSALIKTTSSKSVLKDRGAFGSPYLLDSIRSYKKPVLVSSTDGVGTKLLIANNIGKHDTVGIDLVAMNVNDVLCVGAKPLFFLDYLACGRINKQVLKDVIKGIVEGCKQAGCSLIGGETAEMPGMYKKDDYDLAGFTVGLVDSDKIVSGATITQGDCVLGLPSSGLHSNGFSLARKVLNKGEQKKYAKELLAPTKIYVKDVLKILDKFKIKGIAHITGGAYYEKLTKILPKGKCFLIKKGSWPVPKIFKLIQEKGNVSDNEMYRTFNMGIGLALVVGKKEAPVLKKFLAKERIKFYEIGTVINDNKRKIIL